MDERDEFTAETNHATHALQAITTHGPVTLFLTFTQEGTTYSIRFRNHNATGSVPREYSALIHPLARLLDELQRGATITEQCARQLERSLR